MYCLVPCIGAIAFIAPVFGAPVIPDGSLSHLRMARVPGATMTTTTAAGGAPSLISVVDRIPKFQSPNVHPVLPDFIGSPDIRRSLERLVIPDFIGSPDIRRGLEDLVSADFIGSPDIRRDLERPATPDFVVFPDGRREMSVDARATFLGNILDGIFRDHGPQQAPKFEEETPIGPV
ncbi:hypothetical protein DL96DRAFT_1589238 [Flagelloscypha sp. PMI_526]|nr:hypothetical protein DL96DRAFT_1589238 [Flagelloscypha sp. PMI_526]